VLLADDDRLVLRCMKRILTAEGYDVVTCNDGAEALAQMANRNVDAIVTDVAMPRIGGVELLRAIRAHDKDIPVVMATGAPSIDSAAAAVEYGAFKYLMKPVSAEELRNTVQKAVQMKQLALLRQETLDALAANGGTDAFSGLEEHFSKAMQSLWPTFQPIIRAKDGSLFGYEALLRTDEPTLPSAPAVLDAAERLDALWVLGRMMRARAANIMLDSDPDLHLFLNLHPRDLADPELLNTAAPHCSLASRVVLEVTERAPLEGLGDTRGFITRLREAGFRIAIDDLGAGYSGLTSFVQLEPEFVKLDMSLIRGVESNHVKQRLIRSISEVCRDMGLQVVAEGIETAEERDAIVDLGCDLLQGFRFGRPDAQLLQPTW
jgi:EAL domain-containing protein (putative c-di-GMP-specific phosphodiesterase class I)